MKKITLLFTSVFCASLISAFLFIGCKERKTNPPSIYTDLEGKWMMDPEDYEGDPDFKVMVTFAGDGTTSWDYCLGEEKSTMSGKWGVNGNQIDFVFFYEDEDEDGKDVTIDINESVKFRIDGNVLTMTDSDEEILELTKVN